MGEGICNSVHELEPVSLSELIHREVRVAIETAVHEELLTALGAVPYERSDVRRGYRNGTKTRRLTGPTGLVALTVPRATLFSGAGAKEWTSANRAVVGVLSDGHKRLLALELCSGESFGAWKGCLDDLVARGLRAPVPAIIDGSWIARRAVSEVWPRAAVQRCRVHKLRNLERKSPKHALADAMTFTASRTPPVPTRRGARTCVSSACGPHVALASWPVFVKDTQGSLPCEDAAVVLLFSLVASGQIRLRRIDGWQKIATVCSGSRPREPA